MIDIAKIHWDIKNHNARRFISAIVSHRNDEVLAYLEKGMSANIESSGMYAIQYALIHNNIGAVILLRKFGAKLPKDCLEYAHTQSFKIMLESII